MIDEKVKEQLTELGRQVKRISPDLNGQVIFNCSAKQPEPLVEVRACDVTGKKKK
jgi:hypothetical protein